MAGLSPSCAQPLFLWESPQLGELHSVPTLSLSAFVKMPGAAVAERLRAANTGGGTQLPAASPAFQAWLLRFSHILPLHSTVLALLCGPQGLPSPRGLRSISTLLWVAHFRDKTQLQWWTGPEIKR